MHGAATHPHDAKREATHDAHGLHDRAPAPHAPITHPEDADPLGRAHARHGRHDRTPEERGVIRVLAIGLVAAILAIPILAALSYAPSVNVLVGLSPLILTLALGIAAVGQHYRSVVLIYLLVALHILGLALLWLANLALSVPVNIPDALALSFLLGAIVVAIALMMPARHSEPEPHRHEPKAHVEFHEEKLSDYVHAIEDKVKGLNFAIGRVYRRSNGANDGMRERLRISRDWYNEFYEIKPEDMAAKRNKARIVVHKIHDRLKLLAAKEREVFSEAEVKGLKNLARNRSGEDAIIDVLKTNDRDPVEHYYVSALEVCETILKGLEK